MNLSSQSSFDSELYIGHLFDELQFHSALWVHTESYLRKYSYSCSYKFYIKLWEEFAST